MGKKGTIGPDGKVSRPLAPLEQLKRQQKKKEQGRKDKERREKKFKQQIEDDPETLRRKVGALEKQDKLGLISHRQRQEKWEMKKLLTEYEPQLRERDAAAAAKAKLKPAEPKVEEPVVETPEPKLVQNPALMMSMVPRSVTKKRAVTTKGKTLIPGGLDISREELATSIAPAVQMVEPQAPPTPSCVIPSKTTIDLVPDFGYSSDDNSDDIQEYSPSAPTTTSSVFFNSGGLKAQKRTTTELDDEYSKFMSEVGK